jgi:hypothetical protein
LRRREWHIQSQLALAIRERLGPLHAALLLLRAA